MAVHLVHWKAGPLVALMAMKMADQLAAQMVA